MRSEILKYRIETLPHRALLKSAGLKDEDFNKPFIGIANSYTNIVPGHVHLNKLVDRVKQGIKDAGGVPLEWGVPAVCDGIAMFVEMRLSLPSRDHIADNIEIMVLSHSLDGFVGVTNCDKITPGMLMAAARLDVPAIILTGGPMKANIVNGQRIDPIKNYSIVGKVKAGLMSVKEAEEFSECTVCGPGSCCGLYTANTMACLTETLGMSLKGCATMLALDEKKLELAYETGKRIVELVKHDIKPSMVMTKNAFYNAITVDMALGGSTNTVLHIPAIANELGMEISLDEFDRIARETPNICNLMPAGPYAMEDLDKAGGIPAVLNRLKDKLKPSLTVNGKDIIEIAKEGNVLNEDIIRPLNDPYYPEGGIAIVKGNLGVGVIKQTAVQEDMLKHSGTAKVFTTEKALLKAIEEKRIKEGDVVVINFMGKCGAPGMPEMLTPTDAIKGAGFKKVALLTDGRFSGGTSGPCIGHIEPEAYLKGPIAAVQDGDIIEIDIPNRKLNIKLSEEIKSRLREVKPPKRKLTPLLKRYRELNVTIITKSI